MLEKALGYLRPKAQQTDKPSCTDLPAIPMSEEVNNHFIALAVEDPDEVLDLAAAEVATSNLNVVKKGQGKDRPIDVYELEGPV